MDKAEIIKKYKDKYLGKYYNSRNLSVDDLLTEEDLVHILYEIFEHELDLNDDGRDFLDRYWGFEKIADIIFDYEKIDGDFHRAFKAKEKFVNWLGCGKKEVRPFTEEEKINLEIRNAFYKKYADIKLGGLVDVQEKEYYIAQFNTDDQVLDFLVNLSKGITYLTVMGYEFLKEFFGFKYLSAKLFEKYPQFSKGSVERNLDWLIKDKHSLIGK